MSDALFVRAGLRGWIQQLDEALCRACLRVVGDPPALLTFLFHAVRPEPEVSRMDERVDPTQILSAASLDRFVAYFLAQGYRFVTPEDIRAGLGEGGRYVLMTFDDGYHNNVHVLPVLRRHDVPATFFISTGHVSRGVGFWWDALYRERARRGASFEAIREEQASLKTHTNDQIERYLVERFGAAALDPAGDEDRPLTPDELRAFAREPGVRIGNHTRDHAILTNYSPEGVEEQIGAAQEMLESMVGERPIMISFPNGNHSPAVVDAAVRQGLELGVTVEPGRNPIQLAGGPMRLRRYCFTQGQDVEYTYLTYRSPISLRDAKRRLRAGSAS